VFDLGLAFSAKATSLDSNCFLMVNFLAVRKRMEVGHLRPARYVPTVASSLKHAPFFHDKNQD
jgi:hypothetical protein